MELNHKLEFDSLTSDDLASYLRNSAFLSHEAAKKLASLIKVFAEMKAARETKNSSGDTRPCLKY